MKFAVFFDISFHDPINPQNFRKIFLSQSGRLGAFGDAISYSPTVKNCGTKLGLPGHPRTRLRVYPIECSLPEHTPVSGWIQCQIITTNNLTTLLSNTGYLCLGYFGHLLLHLQLVHLQFYNYRAIDANWQFGFNLPYLFTCSLWKLERASGRQQSEPSRTKLEPPLTPRGTPWPHSSKLTT